MTSPSRASHLTQAVASPVDTASELFAFLAARWHDAYDILGYRHLLKLPNPIHVVTTHGVVTDATFRTRGSPQPAPSAGSPAAPPEALRATGRRNAVDVAPMTRPANRFYPLPGEPGGDGFARGRRASAAAHARLIVVVATHPANVPAG